MILCDYCLTDRDVVQAEVVIHIAKRTPPATGIPKQFCRTCGEMMIDKIRAILDDRQPMENILSSLTPDQYARVKAYRNTI